MFSRTRHQSIDYTRRITEQKLDDSDTAYVVERIGRHCFDMTDQRTFMCAHGALNFVRIIHTSRSKPVRPDGRYRRRRTRGEQACGFGVCSRIRSILSSYYRSTTWRS